MYILIYILKCHKLIYCNFDSDRKVLEQRDAVYEKIAQYLQLKNTIQSIQVVFSKTKTYFDLVLMFCTYVFPDLYIYIFCAM